MGTYLWIALASWLIFHLIQSTIRIYRKLITEQLPGVIQELRHDPRFEMLFPFLENRTVRLTMILPVAFLCTFIILPYDLAKIWHWIQLRIVRFLQKLTQ